MLTRRALTACLTWARKYIYHDMLIYNTTGSSAIMEAASSTIRWGKHITIDHEHALSVLNINKIDFIEDAGGHWAETDGERVWLNRFRQFTELDLCMTLLHEALHGTILVSGEYISEVLEHRIMHTINPSLV